MHNFLFNIIKIQYLGKIIMETPESSSDGHMEAYIQQWADCNLTDIEGIHPERERETDRCRRAAGTTQVLEYLGT